MVDFINNVIEGIKSVGKFFLQNDGLMSLFGVYLGWKLSCISNEKFEAKKEKQKQFDNKPVLYIEKEDKDLEVSLEVFVGTFNVKYDVNKNYEIVYPKDICNKKTHEYKDVVLKNIGKSDIEYLNIASSYKKQIILVHYDLLDTIVNEKAVYYSAWHDRKIRVGDKIKIRIYYQRNNLPCLLLSSTLSFLFEDQYHNYWEQAYFYERDNVYSPYRINYKKFRTIVTPDDAYDCFEDPRLW